MSAFLRSPSTHSRAKVNIFSCLDKEDIFGIAFFYPKVRQLRIIKNRYKSGGIQRVNHQQSFGELFAEISSELIEIDLLTGLLEILKELIELLCQVAGIDFIDFQRDAMKDEKILAKFIDLFPDKQLDTAA